MIRVVVSGAAGRMGRQVIAAVAEDDEIAVSGALEAPGHPALGGDAGALAGLPDNKIIITDDIAAAFELEFVHRMLAAADRPARPRQRSGIGVFVGFAERDLAVA